MNLDRIYFVAIRPWHGAIVDAGSGRAFLTLEDAQFGYASPGAVNFRAIVYRMTARGGRDGDFG
jgi:hypothetical protein